jgi:hypothetical protein
MTSYCLFPFETYSLPQYQQKFRDFIWKNEEANKQLIRILLKQDVSKHYGLTVQYDSTYASTALRIAKTLTSN